MRTKKIPSLVLIGVLTLGVLVGAKVYAATINSQMSKDVLMTETNKQIVQQVLSKEEINDGISREKAVEIMKEALEKYFNEKVDGKNLSNDIRPVYEENGKVAEWIVYWRDEPLSENWELKDTSTLYGGSVDVKTEKITHIGALNGDRNRKAQKVTIKEIKELSVNFIKQNKLIGNMEDIKLIGEYKWGSNNKLTQLVFSYGKGMTDYIYITIDLVNKKVCDFSGGTLDPQNTKIIE
ncbi:hypothetical protein [Anaeromicrobium sediminis]|uniref:Uncharacterized protein n=1 Tax=Anaeromicrobium sediminis TaxID=1478221 RepID=A0A267MQB2_9FIRM|nr:hypothetical protein [Anaeromicrobium sediminis]PAB61095.1 hypothetical protein CCE28_01310 [Anaeromicrobium sediminis]